MNTPQWLEDLRESSEWEKVTEPQETKLVEWVEEHHVPQHVIEDVALSFADRGHLYPGNRPDLRVRKWVNRDLRRQPQAQQPGGWASWQAARSGG